MARLRRASGPDSPGRGGPILLSRRDFLRTSAVVAGLAMVPEVVSACTSAPSTAFPIDRAARFEVHPSVGIARVGNSTDSVFFGPEVPGAIPKAAKGFKDSTGAIAKQAARFRVYAFDAGGKPLGEVPGDLRVEWTVSVANKKPSWYEYQVAPDLPIAHPVPRRNASVTGADRAALAAAVVRSVGGRAAAPVGLTGPVVFGNDVDFGEIITDGDGRLVFLPGSGETYKTPGATIVSFADNDGWADNVCDGTVHAVVHVGNRRVKATAAYVLVTPANYGPAIARGPLSLLDQVKSPLTLAGKLSRQRVSFKSDILPLLTAMVDQQWVNKGFFQLTRPGQEMDWLSAENLAKLADPSAKHRAYRTKIASSFRNPADASSSVDQQPLLIGDGGVTVPPTNEYSWLPVTPLLYDQLQAWARGDFDTGHAPPTTDDLADLPVADQPAALDQAGLASVLGGANHPGVEAPWVLRVPTMWDAAYRLHVQSETMQIRDYGPMLTPATVMGPDGPVHGVSPGDLTMWMGVPWQADAASCRDGYRGSSYAPELSPYLPAYWPARVPNEVLTEPDYETVMDTTKSLEVRQQAFANRQTWTRAVDDIPVPTQQFALFIDRWPEFGVVVDRPGPGDGHFPRTLKVETGVEYHEPVPNGETEYPCRSDSDATCPIDW